MENKLVPPTGIAIDTIAFNGLRGKGLMHTLTGGMRLLGQAARCTEPSCHHDQTSSVT